MATSKGGYLRGRAARTWALGGALGCLILTGLAWFFVISPAISHVSSVKSQTSDVAATNDQLRAKIVSLRSENAKINSVRQSLAADRAALPVASGLPDLTRQLQAQAAQSSVVLTSLTAGTPSVVGAASTATTPNSNATSASVGSTYEIPMTLVADGNLVNQRMLLDLIQRKGPRLALVTSVSFGSSASIDRAVSMTVKFEIFLTPETPAEVAALTQQLKGHSAH
jgi:hypothetical protein